jgi:hypothetical protein
MYDTLEGSSADGLNTVVLIVRMQPTMQLDFKSGHAGGDSRYIDVSSELQSIIHVTQHSSISTHCDSE